MAPKRSKMPNNPFAGVSPDMAASMQKILSTFDKSKYDNNPASLMQHLASQDPADLERLLSAISDQKAAGPNLDTFDFSSISVRKGSFWVMQLVAVGYRTADGKNVDDPVPGAEPLYQMLIYDDKSTYPLTEPVEEPGLPTPAFVLRCIKQAIASPIPPLKPSLPNLLIIARKLSPFVATLRPFLDSLPAPFSWRLETQEEADEVAGGVDAKNRLGVRTGLADAESEKALGNQAVARKDRAVAVKHYSKAVAALESAWAQSPTDQQKAEIKALLSVCLANRAAAYLMDGEGQDPKKALKDAEEACHVNELYGKAYYRQAKAYQLLSDPSKAIDILTPALKKPSLAQDNGLIDALVYAYGGFPDTEDDLRQFYSKIFRDDDGDKRARDLEGFRRRAEEHLKSVIGPDASLDAI